MRKYSFYSKNLNAHQMSSGKGNVDWNAPHANPRPEIRIGCPALFTKYSFHQGCLPTFPRRCFHMWHSTGCGWFAAVVLRKYYAITFSQAIRLATKECSRELVSYGMSVIDFTTTVIGIRCSCTRAICTRRATLRHWLKSVSFLFDRSAGKIDTIYYLDEQGSVDRSVLNCSFFIIPWNLSNW